ncbi:MAG: hypothetical protein IKM61_00415 [Eubacteriaceae bacterium]|nr:hypothetical protein [Eubacteriaceae bacterium]
MNKKLLSIILALFMCFAFFSCTKDDAEKLPAPTYPMTAEYLQESIDGLKDGYVVNDNTFYDNYTGELKGIVLGIAEKSAPEFEQAAVITNTLKNERGFGLTCISGTVGALSGEYSYAGKSYTPETSEKVIKFATKLFGGFSDEEAVYKKFQKEFSKKNTGIKEVTSEILKDKAYVNYVWRSEIDGIDCEIVFKKMSNQDTMYLYSIIFMTDREVFDEYSNGGRK